MRCGLMGGRDRCADERGVCVQGQKCFPVRRMQGPKQWVMQERRRGDGASGRGSGHSNGEGRRRSEPAATDTTLPGIADAVCPGMADGIHMGMGARAHAANGGGTEAAATMNVPVASNVVMAYPYGYQSEARVCYGAYVSLAHMFGVPSQRGLRDYWRHVYLFRERALAAAQVIEGGPQRSVQASTGPGALDSQATLMSLTSHQSFTVCGSTVTATGSARRGGGGSGVVPKGCAPSTTTTATRMSDTVIGPVAVAAGKAFRGSPDSHNSEGADVQDDGLQADATFGAAMLPDELDVVPPYGTHVHVAASGFGSPGERRGRVQPSQEVQRSHRRAVDPGGRGSPVPGHRSGGAPMRSFRLADAEHAGARPRDAGHAGHAGPASAASHAHAARDMPQFRSAGPRDRSDRSHAAVGRRPAQPSAAVLQFERPRMHVTNKGGVTPVADARESGAHWRGAAGGTHDERSAASGPHAGTSAGHAAGGPAAGSAPVAAWLRDHAVPRAAGVMAERATQQLSMRGWESGHSHDGAEWVTAESAAPPEVPAAMGAGEGHVVLSEIEQSAASHVPGSEDSGQV